MSVTRSRIVILYGEGIVWIILLPQTEPDVSKPALGRCILMMSSISTNDGMHCHTLIFSESIPPNTLFSKQYVIEFLWWYVCMMQFQRNAWICNWMQHTYACNWYVQDIFLLTAKSMFIFKALKYASLFMNSNWIKIRIKWWYFFI